MKVSVSDYKEKDIIALAEAAYMAREKTLLPKEITAEIIAERFQKFFTEYPSKVITASLEDSIEGFQILFLREDNILELNPGTILGGFPVILSRIDPEKVADLIFKETVLFAEREGFRKIEILTDLFEEDNPMTRVFLEQGFEIDQKYAEMLFDLSDIPGEIKLPDKVCFNSLSKASKEELYRCYYDSFSAGDAAFFHSQSEKERRDYFETLGLEEALKEPSSMIVTEEDKLIGFSLVLPYGENNTHISCMCIENSYRGKGLGKALLFEIFKKSKEKGDKTITLGTDIRMKAFKLYMKTGFRITEGNILLVKRL